MDKTNRIIYGTPLMNHCGEALSKFVLAFEQSNEAKKISYLEESFACFVVLRTDLEFCEKMNIIHVKTGDGHSTEKIELFKVVAKIDNDMCKWRASLAKGKTIVA